jgi:hypothetical protein
MESAPSRVPELDVRGPSTRAHRHARWLKAFASLVVLAILSHARASSADARDVVVAIAGRPAEVDALRLVVHDLLVQQGTSVDIHTVDSVDADAVIDKPARFTPVLARAWVDLRPTDHAMVYLVDGTWDRVLVRRVACDAEHLEVCREDIGHILETAVEAMMSGAKIGVERVVLVRPPPRVEPARPVVHERPAQHIAFRLGLTSETIVFSKEAPLAQALGVTASLDGALEAKHDPLRFGAWLTIALRLPLRAAALPIGVQLEGIEARLVPRITVPIARALRFEAGVGPGFDLLEATAIADTAGATISAPRLDPSFVVRTEVGLRLWRTLGVILAADFDVTRHDYVFTWNGARAVPLSPFAVRPVLALEASF